MNKSLKTLVTVSLLISLEIVLSRFLSISTPIMKIGFGFLPIAICGMFYGPILAGVAGGISDLIGAILFPIAGYFPGFTFSAILTGVIFGIFLHEKELSTVKLTIAVVINTVGISLLLNTYWITVISGSSFIALLPTRVVQAIIMGAVQFVLIRVIKKPIAYFIKNQYV